VKKKSTWSRLKQSHYANKQLFIWVDRVDG